MRERLGLPKSADGSLWYYARALSTGILQPHTHRELEFNLVTRGTASYLIQGDKITLTPGLLIWLFPSQLHLLVDQSPDLEMWIGVFTPSLVRRIAKTASHAPLNSLDPGQVLARRISPEPAARIATLCHWYDRTTHPPLAPMNAGIGLVLAECWTAYLSAQDTPDPSLRRQLHPSVQKCVQHLLQSRTPLKIQSLAAQCGVAPATLSRLFKRDTGMSLATFRNTHRLELFFERWHAQSNTTNPKNLLETALAAGFGSYPQFHRVFKQLTGKSPATLKK